jgi:hypothetical protein
MWDLLLTLQVFLLLITAFCTFVFPWFSTLWIWREERRFVIFLGHQTSAASSGLERKLNMYCKRLHKIAVLSAAVLTITIFFDEITKELK